MNKPEPLTPEEIHNLDPDAHAMFDKHRIDFAKAIEAEVNRRWEEMLSKQEPVAYVVTAQYEDGSHQGHRLEWRGRNEANDFAEGTALYTHPAPQQKPQKLLLEHSGCGHGTQVEQVTVRLNRGDKVVLLMGPHTAATEAKK
jgi:hypothetical protein